MKKTAPETSKEKRLSPFKALALPALFLTALMLVVVALYFKSTQQDSSPQVLIQKGHINWVNSIEFSPDGKTLATSGLGSVKLWDVATGKMLHSFGGYGKANRIEKLIFSPNRRTLVVLSANETRLWDTTTGEPKKIRKSLAKHAYLADFSPNGKILATVVEVGLVKNHLKLWDTATYKHLRTIKGDIPKFGTLTFSPDSKTLALATQFGDDVWLWDTATGKPRYTLEDQGGRAVFSPDGTILITTKRHEFVKLWDAATGTLLHTLNDRVEYEALSPDGKILATVNKKEVKLWEVATGTLVYAIQVEVPYVDFSADGKHLATFGAKHPLKLWNVATGELYNSFENQIFSSVRFSSDGKNLATAKKREVKLWEATTGKLRHSLQNHPHLQQKISISPDGNFLLSGLLQWDLVTGELLGSIVPSIKRKNVGAKHKAFSPNGEILAYGFREQVRLWDLASHSELHLLKLDSRLAMLAFSPDGKTLITGEKSGTVTRWDVVTGERLQKLENLLSKIKRVEAFAMSADGKFFASFGWLENVVELWDADSGALVDIFKKDPASSVKAVALSPEGKTLAIGYWDHTIILWNRVTGERRTLRGHSRVVNSVAFSPDGQYLASGSWAPEKTVKLWDAATGKILNTFRGHTSSIEKVVFSPDGKALYSTADTRICIWNLAKQRLALSLTSFDKSDWIAWTPEGYFNASSQASQMVFWRVGDRITSFSRYDNVFKKPDMIRRALAGEALLPPTIQVGQDFPPLLSDLNPSPISDRAEYEVILGYEGHEFGEIVVLLNGIPQQTGTPPKDGKIRIWLNLEYQRNTLEVMAMDQNLLKSNWLKKDIMYPKGAKGPGPVQVSQQRPQTTTLGSYGKKYAIIIGISDYEFLSQSKGALMDLRYAHKDAMAFREFLEDPSLSGGNWKIHTFTEEQATFTELDKTLTQVLTYANRRDLIYIFFSGHARAHPLRPQDVYLLTHDAKPQNPRAGYPYSLLLDLINDTRAEHVVAFIDSCNSGTIPFGTKGETQGPIDIDILGRRVGNIQQNRVIFTSASGKQRSWEEPKWEQGVFTHFLIQGLQGQAQDENYPEYVDLGELFKYVRQNVSQYTKENQRMELQLPHLWEKDGAPEEAFPIAIRRH